MEKQLNFTLSLLDIDIEIEIKEYSFEKTRKQKKEELYTLFWAMQNNNLDKNDRDIFKFIEPSELGRKSYYYFNFLDQSDQNTIVTFYGFTTEEFDQSFNIFKDYIPKNCTANNLLRLIQKSHNLLKDKEKFSHSLKNKREEQILHLIDKKLIKEKYLKEIYPDNIDINNFNTKRGKNKIRIIPIWILPFLLDQLIILCPRLTNNFILLSSIYRFYNEFNNHFSNYHYPDFSNIILQNHIMLNNGLYLSNTYQLFTKKFHSNLKYLESKNQKNYYQNNKESILIKKQQNYKRKRKEIEEEENEGNGKKRRKL